MSTPTDMDTPPTRFRDALETTIRIGLVLGLLAWVFSILLPFVTIVLWGFILAIAVSPAYLRVTALLGGRRGLAATAFVLLGIALFIAPAAQITGTLVGGVHDFAARFGSGEVTIPPLPPSVAEWPVVGERIAAFWSLAGSNLEAALQTLAPQLKALAGWLVGAAAELGIGILKFVFSMVIAGVVLANGTTSRARVQQVFARLIGANGPAIATLAESTIRSVATGIVGVALIQTTLAGIGLVVVGVPGAELLIVATLLLCIVQLGPALILIPACVYVFSTAETLTASLFLGWSIFVALLDNFLKPLLLGRGVDAPILVIFMGAIGGFVSMGIIGLFVGAVVLVLFYTLFRSWLDESLAPELPTSAQPEPAPAE